MFRSHRCTRALATAFAATAALGVLAGCGSTASKAGTAGPSSSASGPTSPSGTSGTAGSAGSGGDSALHAMLPPEVQKAGKVSVASDIPYAPFEFFDPPGSQHITGLDYDLGQAIGQKLGISFDFQEAKFESIVTGVAAGKYDVVMSSMTDNKEREKSLDFVDYSVSGSGITVVKGNPDHITTIKDLCGKSVGIEAGTIQIALINSQQKNCTGAKIKVLTFPKNSDALLAMKSGRVQAVASDKPVALYTAKTTDGGKDFQVVDDPNALSGYQASPNGIGVKKGRTALADAIQKGLQALIADGSYKKILAKYDAGSLAISSATLDKAVN